MIYNVTNEKLQRQEVERYIHDKKLRRVVDVGGVLGPWARSVVTHYVDLQGLGDARRNDANTCDEYMERAEFFQCDISDPSTWKVVFNDIAENGYFDFVICTQTLEHVASPVMALRFLQGIALQGFISVPNKYTELRRGVAFSDEGFKRCGVNGHWRGFLPHRWIYTVRDEMLWVWPKLNFLEYLDGIDEWIASDAPNPSDVELSLWWKGTIPNKIITDQYVDHPDPEKACKFFAEELRKGV